MKDFIEKIEKIGFEEVFKHRLYKYDNWRIDITGKSVPLVTYYCWHLTYSDGNPDPLNRVEVTHGFIPFDDRDMLKKYFASELREITLNLLGIE